jgi:DNA-binding HxlR family transcriptional regulator
MLLSECPVRPTIDVIEGKWKPIIVNALKQGTLRFGQLRRQSPEATRKVLTEQLRELEGDGIVTRKVIGKKWERVEYSLTSYGRTLVPVLTLMAKWGKTHRRLKSSPVRGTVAPSELRNQSMRPGNVATG